MLKHYNRIEYKRVDKKKVKYFVCGVNGTSTHFITQDIKKHLENLRICENTKK